ncbi:serine-rich coiled-coil domain-containing protein 2-like isoform X2 [Entelurus aequoreus]|uniref:serine-rich coiled-coil domain-containing protein 2-like isoform X2 n=1 Tax=Entelurus aequoreus TaxID=161455 RepID=UPI002B1E4B35|nr:serine-rich coiled-coil domain-containing protein 2-like isoform X2 [Entelurus aequoreus]
MEDKASTRFAMVSRLPKFGGRSASTGATSLSNGLPTQDAKTTPSPAVVSRPNGVIKTSPFSLKWKRDEGATSSSVTSPTNPVDGGKDKPSRPLPATVKAPGTPIMRRSGALVVAASSPKTITKQTLKLGPKEGSKLSPGPMNGAPKIHPNDPGISAGSDSRLARPKLYSPRSSSQDSLSQSSESLKTLALDKMVRSNSFTHFKQIPSPSSQPMIRSFSFNRAVELAKPLTNTQLRTPRSSFLKPPHLSNGRLGLGLGGLNVSHGGSGSSSNGIGGLQYSRTAPATSSSISPGPTTPIALKKPLLSTFNKSPGNTNGSLGYKLTKPGQTKQNKTSFLPGWLKGDAKALSATQCGDLSKTERDSEPAGEAEDPHSSQNPADGKETDSCGLTQSSADPAGGDAQEDMSLSSASSLDRGNTSEEFLDDLDSVGDVFSDGDVHDHNNSGLDGFLGDNSDWDLADHNEESPMQDSQGPLVRSPVEADLCQASSLELSPSDSSGGTYMWDEEGLEPLGGPGTHPCDLYDDSELSSMVRPIELDVLYPLKDTLNNLHPPGPQDDDDLMLDVDLPEDGVHDADRISNGESAARRQAQRRRHQRLGGPAGFDARTQSPQGLKSSKMSPQAAPSEARRLCLGASPDELSLEHLSQDCSSVKKQLLRLRNLLQREDPDLPAADVVQDGEGNTATAAQCEELLKEVHMLREEVRTRDKTIVQLTLQCQQQHPLAPVQCQCHQQRAPSLLLRPPAHQRHDKATQTHWRPPGHPHHLPLHVRQQGAAVRTLTEDRTEGSPRDDAPLHGLVSALELSRLLGAHGSSSGAQLPSLNLAPGCGAGVPLPATTPLRHSSSLAGRSRQLPPPSRGLPGFNTNTRPHLPGLSRTSPPRPGGGSDSKMWARSCLPKPKIP